MRLGLKMYPFTLRKKTVLLIGFLVLSSLSFAEDYTIKIISRDDGNARYAIGVVKLALKKINKPYQIEIIPGEFTSKRLEESMLQGTDDVYWAGTTQELEDKLIPIRIPIEKGLLGHRIFIIQKDNKHLLDGVKTPADLKKFTMGQGRGWPDADILKANGFTVVLAPKYESLFYMVDGKRFDLFPRGVNEPFNEIQKRPKLDLTVDENIMLVYKMPFYLFINPAKKQLARDIENGMMGAIEDGSFDEYFYANETTQQVINSVSAEGRRIFEINTPNLPPKTPVDNPKLWIKFEDLAKHKQH